MSEKQPKARVPGFGTWLAQQVGRDDPVGDLARDSARDPGRPGARAQYRGWVNHLEAKQACSGAFDALFCAWQEYTFENKPGFLGLPAMLTMEQADDLHALLAEHGVKIEYNDLGESTMSISKGDEPRIAALVRAWWKDRGAV